MLRGWIGAVLVAGVSLSAGAQRPIQRPERFGAPPAGMGQRRQQLPADRVALERQVRQAFARAARERLKLSDAQMKQLARVNQRFAVQRRELNGQERDVRLALVSAMRDTMNPDQEKIASYIDQLIAMQRKRIDLVAAEQQELSTFMTPLQRAQYQALQERVRRRLEQMRQGAAAPSDTASTRPPK